MPDDVLFRQVKEFILEELSVWDLSDVLEVPVVAADVWEFETGWDD